MCTPQLIQQAAEIKAQSMSAPSAVPSPLPGLQQIEKVYPEMPVSQMFETIAPPVVQDRSMRPPMQPVQPKYVDDSMGAYDIPAGMQGQPGRQMRPQHVIQQSHQVMPREQHMMKAEYSPYMNEIQPITSQLTIGDLLGIKPGQYEEVGGPGNFRNLNVPLR